MKRGTLHAVNPYLGTVTVTIKHSGLLYVDIVKRLMNAIAAAALYLDAEQCSQQRRTVCSADEHQRMSGAIVKYSTETSGTSASSHRVSTDRLRIFTVADTEAVRFAEISGTSSQLFHTA